MFARVLICMNVWYKPNQPIRYLSRHSSYLIGAQDHQDTLVPNNTRAASGC
jgi:hypothetical protein